MGSSEHVLTLKSVWSTDDEICIYSAATHTYCALHFIKVTPCVHLCRWYLSVKTQARTFNIPSELRQLVRFGANAVVLIRQLNFYFFFFSFFFFELFRWKGFVAAMWKTTQLLTSQSPCQCLSPLRWAWEEASKNTASDLAGNWPTPNKLFLCERIDKLHLHCCL